MLSYHDLSSFDIERVTFPYYWNFFSEVIRIKKVKLHPSKRHFIRVKCPFHISRLLSSQGPPSDKSPVIRLIYLLSLISVSVLILTQDLILDQTRTVG